MSRVLITGAYGFIGRAIARAAAENGLEVHACSSRSDIQQPYITHQVDLLDKNQVDQLFREVKPALLIQTAWCTAHGAYWTDKANLAWVAANNNIAEAFISNKGEYAIFTGTSAEYSWEKNDPLSESAELKPVSLYGAAKLSSFISLNAFFAQAGVPMAWTRLFNPFGEFEDPRRLIPKICNKVLSGESIHFDAGMEQRDFLHIDDLASAYLSLTKHRVTGPVNVASGIPRAIREVVSTVATAACRPELVHFSQADGLQKESIIFADVTKLTSTTDWKPFQTFNDRVRQTINWWASKEKNKQIL
jgi:nucleoside-diphosphate-sugar epimerase